MATGPVLLTTAFIATNLLLLGAWLAWFGRRESDPGDVLVYACLAVIGQIAAYELLLGAVGQLRLGPLLGLHIATAMGLLADAWRRRRPEQARPSLRAALGALSAWHNIALLLLGALLLAWLGTATALLPPRGIDDLAYHLPPVYQAVQDQALTRLPVELRDQFAMPQNGELLFVWPAIFFHADQWVDGVQLVTAGVGALVLAALARSFGMPAREAAFVGLLFAFVPVVIGQAGSAYVDLIVAVTHLALIYAAVRFWQTGRSLHLWVAGLVTGFGLGTKYSMVAFAAAAQPLLWVRLARERPRVRALMRYGAYGLFCLPLGAYWYLRNAVETGHPLYPYSLGLQGLRRLAGTPGAEFLSRPADRVSALAELVRQPELLAGYPFMDLGLGSLHGGFGMVFWGMCLPALAWWGWRAARQWLRGRGALATLVWAQVPLAFLVLFQRFPPARVELNVRLIVVVTALGLLALGLALQRIGRVAPLAAGALRALCVAASLLAVIQVAGYELPSYRIEAAARDRLAGTQTSPFRYLATLGGDFEALAGAWEPLDFLSQATPGGWQVYSAAEYRTFFAAPLYGSRLQNRVWNFAEAPAGWPDAVVFHTGVDPRPLFYLGPPLTPTEIRRDSRYELVNHAPTTELWVGRDRLAEPEVRARLLAYYRQTYGSATTVMTEIAQRLTEDLPVVTASPWGYALRYLAQGGALEERVAVVPWGTEREWVARQGLQRAYSLVSPIEQARATLVAELRTSRGPLRLFLNELDP